jgi:filamentous hemagglutinin family protein
VNRVYRLVWNEQQSAFVVASETARARGKRSGGRAAVTVSIAAAGLLSLAAWGAPNTLPTGGQVSSGQASIASSGNVVTVTQGTEQAAINWQSFSIGSSAAVNFQQPNASAVILNRVVGGEQSVIEGALNANGQVFLLNASGVLFGKGASVNTAGLVASTLGISDADFMAGNRTFTASGSRASVINLGTISAADGGYVALLGNQVSNQGVITARLGTVALAAGDRISLDFNGNSLLGVAVDRGSLAALVENRDAIVADGGLVVLTAKGLDAVLAGAVNNTGEIRARTIDHRGGRILLLGDMQSATVDVGGSLDASAPDGGNGGFIETSAAHVKIGDDAHITTVAPQGVTGTWLVDPVDFTIAATGGDITGSALSAQLATTDISLSSTNGANGTLGNLNVDDTVSWSAHKLTLTAVNDVNINAVMTATGSASLDLEPGSNKVNVGLNGSGFTGRVDFSGSGTLTIDNQPYVVLDTLAGIQAMSLAAGGYYALGSNIDATGQAFSPLGPAGPGFGGTFDGLGHTIGKLTINLPSTGFVGLFGNTASTAVVRNIGLISPAVTGKDGVGALVGFNLAAISNSYVSGTGSVSGRDNVGGLVGYDGSTVGISDSFATITVSGRNGVGGLVGANGAGAITDTYATGNVTGTGSAVGGLIGSNGTPAISDSYATGSATGLQRVGGLAGYNFGNITDCYATGTAFGNVNVGLVGGLVGLNYGGTLTHDYAAGSVNAVNSAMNFGGLVGLLLGGSVSNSIWNAGTAGQVGIGGPAASQAGAIGLSPAALQQSANFTSVTSANGSANPGWDFSNTWVMYDGYTNPLLRVFMTPLTITTAPSKTYDGSVAGGAVTYSIAPDPGHLLGTLTLAGAGSGIGTYAGVTPSGLHSDQQGYIISYAAGTLTVDPRPVSLSGTKVYDGTDVATSGALAVTNLVNGDALTLGGNATLSASGVGTEGLGLAGLSIDNLNYTLIGGSGSVMVTARPVSVTTVGGASKLYDGTATAPAKLLVVSNLVGGDSVTLSGSGSLSGSGVGSESLIGLAGLSLNNPNYSLVGGTASGSVSILAAGNTPGSNAPVANKSPVAGDLDDVIAAAITSAPAIVPPAGAEPEAGAQAGAPGAGGDLKGFGNVLNAPAGLVATFGDGARLAVISAPNADEPTQVVSISQARALLTTDGLDASATSSASDDQAGPDGRGKARANPSVGTGTGDREVRVPASANSLAEIVNGGVKLPNGLEQQLFVVRGR